MVVESKAAFNQKVSKLEGEDRLHVLRPILKNLAMEVLKGKGKVISVNH